MTTTDDGVGYSPYWCGPMVLQEQWDISADLAVLYIVYPSGQQGKQPGVFQATGQMLSGPLVRVQAYASKVATQQ